MTASAPRMHWPRRRFLSGIATTAALGVAASGCNRGGEAELDPTYDVALPTMEDVDDSLAALVTGERVRVVYKPDGAIAGASEPLVTLVEFSDFECPFCGAFAETIEELLRAYPEDLRVVFMQFPLPMHSQAEGAARAAIAAGAQRRFWAMHDGMFAQRTQLEPDDLAELAERLGLDRTRFVGDLDSEATRERLTWEMAIGSRLGVRGTPSMFVNGRPRSGAVPPPELHALIDEERALARRLIDAGAPRNAVYAHINRAARVAGAAPAAAGAPQGAGAG